MASRRFSDLQNTALRVYVYIINQSTMFNNINIKLMLHRTARHGNQKLDNPALCSGYRFSLATFT